MKPKELIELIALGESSKLEFKRKLSSPEKIAKEIAALANTRGGQLLVGIDDDGTIVGVRSEKSEIDIIQTACEFFIEPPVAYDIDIISIYGTDVVVANIPESKHKPHIISLEDNERTVKRAYIRVGEKSVMASREMFRLMKFQSDRDKNLMLSIGDREKRLFAYIEFHGRATVSDFAKMVNISKRQAERIMIKLVQAGVLQIHNDSTHDYFTMI
jgi:predicted HTH transcriptional regulator